MRGPTNDVDIRSRVFLTIVLVGIAAGGIVDLVLDRPPSPWSFHVVLEVALLAFCLGSASYLWAGWMRARRYLARTRQALDAHTSERDAWRERAEKLLRGLGEEIDAQMHRWALTRAEKETALFLLKGFGHKEIAALLGKSERTVRQHAVAVYRKSGLSGRAELSAFFLEDLLLPSTEGEKRVDSDA